MDNTTLFYAILFFILFLCNCIFIGGIADQAQYGPKVCLLYVENYHMDAKLNAYIFNAYSTACGGAIAIGVISLLTGLAMAALIAIHKWKRQILSVTTTLGVACIASFMSFLMLVIASVVSAGINQTCRQFTVATGSSCAAIFSDGFFADDPNTRYVKNLSTVSAAAGAGWVAFLCWVIFAGYEWFMYRKEAQRWW